MNPVKLTIVATVRTIKIEIPPEISHLLSQSIRIAIHCFDKTKTLLAYKTKRNKSVILLSTFREKPIVDQEFIRNRK